MHRDISGCCNVLISEPIRPGVKICGPGESTDSTAITSLVRISIVSRVLFLQLLDR